MKSFHSFIAEAKLVQDIRTDPNKPFGVTFNGWAGDHTKGAPYDKEMTFFDHDEPNRRGTYIVDPKSKTVSYNPAETYSYANRRYNEKIKMNMGNKAKPRRSTPVIGIEEPSIGHRAAKSLAAHINPDEYSFNGKPLRHYMAPQKTAHHKWVEGREPITVYHGTSEKRARDILSTGLKPGQRPEHEHYQDLLPNYSEHNVYLTPHANEAANYATRQAIHDGSKPVVLKTTIHPHDFGKIRPDEDAMNWWKNSVPEHMKTAFVTKHPEMRETMANDMHYKWLDHTDKSKLPWTEDHLRSLHAQSTGGHDFETWKTNVRADLDHAFQSRPPMKARADQGFAYKGDIPAHKIQRHATWDLHATSADPKPDEYAEAYNKMKASLKFG